jgi:hypothetical protein
MEAAVVECQGSPPYTVVATCGVTCVTIGYAPDSASIRCTAKDTWDSPTVKCSGQADGGVISVLTSQDQVVVIGASCVNRNVGAGV